MFVGNIREDFDNLRGEATYNDVAHMTGVRQQTVHAAFDREFFVAPQIIRMFEAIGYDIGFVYIPKGKSGSQSITNTSDQKAPRTIYQIRRGTIRMKSHVPETNRLVVSANAMMDAADSQGIDISALKVVGDYRNQMEGNAAYQEIKKNLSSYEKNDRDYADVLMLLRIDADGTITTINKWAGKLTRKAIRGPGRPPKEETRERVIPSGINDAVKILKNRS